MTIQTRTYVNKKGEEVTSYRVNISTKKHKIDKYFKNKYEAETFIDDFEKQIIFENNLQLLNPIERQKEIIKRIDEKQNEIEKEELYIELYKSCLSFQDFFNLLGLINNAQNFYKYKKIFKRHAFNGKKQRDLSKKIDYDRDMFIENSPYCRSTVKRVIIRNNLIKYECMECKNIGQWNNKPLILQLEHINGLPNDNRKENLAFLCPNCHSQTSTFGACNKEIKVVRVVKEITACTDEIESSPSVNSSLYNKTTQLQKCHDYAISKGGKCLSLEYINSNTKLEWKCHNEEHPSWLSNWEHAVKRQRWCPECNGGKKNQNGLIFAQEKAKQRNGLCLSINYVNSDQKLEWKCHNEQHPSWFSAYDSVVKRNTWCRKCYTEESTGKPKRLRENQEQPMPDIFVTLLERATRYAHNKKGQCLTSSIQGNNSKLTWKCHHKEHAEWRDSYVNVVNNHKWCPNCK